MRPETDLSIIIVNWNGGETFLRCLRSVVQGATSCHTEIIVVDNASTDGSPDAVEREFPEITLIRNRTNEGFAKANNIGIRRSTGRYVALINPDVIVTPGSLDRMLTFMTRHPSIGVLGPQVLNEDSTLQLSCREFPNLWNSFCRALALDTMFPSWRLLGGYLMTYWSHDTTRRVDVLSGCFWLIRQQALDTVGLLDEDFFMYSEDVDFCKRVWRAGWEVVYWPHVKVVHYGGICSSHFPVHFNVAMLQAGRQYWRKHHGRVARICFWAISLLHQARRTIQGAVLYSLRREQKRNTLTEVKSSVACFLWLLGSQDRIRIGRS